MFRGVSRADVLRRAPVRKIRRTAQLLRHTRLVSHHGAEPSLDLARHGLGAVGQCCYLRVPVSDAHQGRGRGGHRVKREQSVRFLCRVHGENRVALPRPAGHRAVQRVLLNGTEG